MSDASSGGGYKLPSKKVVKAKVKLTAVGQRGPVVAKPKVVRKKASPTAGVTGSVTAAKVVRKVSPTKDVRGSVAAGGKPGTPVRGSAGAGRAAIRAQEAGLNPELRATLETQRTSTSKKRDLVGDIKTAGHDIVGGLRAISQWDPIGGHHGTSGIASIDAQRAGPRIVQDVADATIEHPGKTLEGAGKAVIGTVGAAGDVGLPVLDAAGHLITGHPGKALHDVERSGQAVGRLVKGIPADYKRRYGPYFTGQPEKAHARLMKEGAGPELLDAATATLGVAKVAGPGVRGLVRRSAKGKELLDAPRPKLRVSGGKTVDQTVGPSLVRTVVQRTQDKARQYRVEHQKPDVQERVQALQPKAPVRKSVERHNRKVAKHPATSPKVKPRVVRKTHETRIDVRGSTVQERLAAHPELEKKWGDYITLHNQDTPFDPTTWARYQQLEKDVAPILKGDGASLKISHYSAKKQSTKEPAVVRRSVTVPTRVEEVVPLSKRWAAHHQRVSVSRTSATSYIRNKREQTIEIGQGAEKALAGLSRKQRRATYHVLQGLVPIHGSVADIVTALKEHKAALRDAPGGIPVLRRQTEAATVDYLIKHADEVFSDGRLQAFHAGEVARAKRVAKGDPGVRAATAQARVYRPQGERLGIPYKEPAENLTPAERDAHNLQYVQTVKQAAAKKGLPEPVYFQHNKHPTVRVSARTASNVGRAVRGPKQSKGVLFREGRAITSPDQYIQGLADTIKRKHQWHAVADAAHDHAFDWSLGTHGKGLHIDELRTLIAKRRLRDKDVMFVDFGRVRKTADGLDHTDAVNQANVSTALDSAIIDPAKKGQLVPTDGRYVAVPRAAGEELQAAMRPAGKPTRVIGALQGMQSAYILGTNPSWLQMQLVANTLQAGVGMRGNLLDVVRAQSWYRQLPPHLKAVVDDAANVGVFEGHVNAPHLGYHQGKVSTAFEHMGQVPLWRTKHGTLRLTDINPLRVMFRLDNAQNAAFRKAVLYNELKRQQFQELAHDVGHAQAALKQVTDMLRGDAKRQLDTVLKDPRKVEAAARYTDAVIGDYLRYTAAERRFFKPYILFYGFMRYATKTLFYTLPVKHPLAASIALKLGQLHNEEVYRIFGTRDLPPWVLSRSYTYDNQGQVKRDKLGRPMYRDLARINPVTTPLIDAVTEGPQALAGLISPLMQGAADVVAGRDVQTHVPIRVNRSTAEAKLGLLDPNVPQIMLNRLAKSGLPGRLLLGGGAQSDDSLPFHRQPLRYKTPAAKARDAQRQADAPSVEQQLFPLFVPRPDTTQALLDRQGRGNVGAIDQTIKVLEAHKAMLERTGRDRENGTYQTAEYEKVKLGIRQLQAEKGALVNAPKKKPKVTLKRRPLSTGDQVRKSVQDLRKRDVRKEVLDEIARLREQAKVNSGG